MNTIYRAYLIDDPNKGYCGQDSNWPSRKRAHLNADDNFLFTRALKKYGAGAFAWEILYQDEDKDWTLNVMEEYYIRKYKTHMSHGGYNMTWGGEGAFGRIVLSETRNKISKGLFGHKRSEETKKRVSVAKQNPSTSTREKMRLAKLGKSRDKKTREKLSESHCKRHQYWGA